MNRHGVEIPRDKIAGFCRRHQIRRLSLFGSILREDFGPDSDIDLLVKPGERVSSWFPAGLIRELEQALGRQVDVVTDNGLNPYLRDTVMKEAVAL